MRDASGRRRQPVSPHCGPRVDWEWKMKDETRGDVRRQLGSTPSLDTPLAPRLAAAHMSLLRRFGEVRATVAGQRLFREGDRSYDFIVVLSGKVSVLDNVAGVERELAIAGPRDFVAE